MQTVPIPPILTLIGQLLQISQSLLLRHGAASDGSHKGYLLDLKVIGHLVESLEIDHLFLGEELGWAGKGDVLVGFECWDFGPGEGIHHLLLEAELGVWVWSMEWV